MCIEKLYVDFKEWMEAIVFLNFDRTEKLEKKRGKVVKKAMETGERLCAEEIGM